MDLISLAYTHIYMYIEHSNIGVKWSGPLRHPYQVIMLYCGHAVEENLPSLTPVRFPSLFSEVVFIYTHFLSIVCTKHYIVYTIQDTVYTIFNLLQIIQYTTYTLYIYNVHTLYIV